MIRIFLFLIVLFSVANAEDSRLFPINNKKDTLVIISTMFEFNKDSITNTALDGKFVLKNNGLHLEGAPHNNDYFKYHLEYAKNYFLDVSDSNLVIKYKVLPKFFPVYQLPHKIQYYSPDDVEQKDDSLMALTRDVINILGKDQMFLSVWNSERSKENDNYKVQLAVFYAGVSAFTDGYITGQKNSPWDISNAYIRPVDFEKYSSIVSKANILNVDRMILLPEQSTQDTLEYSMAHMNLFEMSFNSMMVYQIYKTLGVPDLSRISGNEISSFVGIFTPMDVFSLFNVKSAGLFSPNPGAWERDYLGWGNVIDASVGDTVMLKRDNILKIKLKSSQYYLFGLRGTDESKTAIEYYDPSTLLFNTKEISKNDFYMVDGAKIKQNLFNGIVTHIENNDLFLPNTGVLAWRINDDIISKYIKTDNINNGSTDEYGVDLIEKDGDEDVGFAYITDLFGNKIFMSGDSSDVYYKDDSLLLMGCNGENSHIKIKILDVNENLAKICIYSDLLSKVILKNEKFKKFSETFFDSISVNGNLAYFVENRFFYGGNLLYESSLNIKKVIPVHEKNSNLINFLLLFEDGSLNYISQKGNSVPYYEKPAGVKNIFLIDSSGTNKILVFKLNSFIVYNRDFSVNHSYYKIGNKNMRLDDFPVILEYGDGTLVDKFGFYTKITDSLFTKYSISNFGDSIVGITGNYTINSSLNSKFDYKYYIYPNPIKVSDFNINFRFYSNEAVENAVIDIYDFSSKHIKSISFSPDIGWNKVKYNISGLKSDLYMAILSFKKSGKTYSTKKRFAVRK